jgi:hypothetical protein
MAELWKLNNYDYSILRTGGQAIFKSDRLLETFIQPPALPASTPIPAIAAPAPRRDAVPSGDDAFAGVRTHLETMRRHHDDIAAARNEKGESEDQDAPLVRKSQALHSEVSALLTANHLSEEGAQRLRRLRDRLQPKNLAGVLADRAAEDRANGTNLPPEEPAATTLTRHR